MKIYSLITICVTLGLFYGLAVFEQNKKANEEKQNTDMKKIMMYHQNLVCKGSISTEDESFEMTVSGKDHRYLNTGLTFHDYTPEPYPDRFDKSPVLVASDD